MASMLARRAPSDIEHKVLTTGTLGLSAHLPTAGSPADGFTRKPVRQKLRWHCMDRGSVPSEVRIACNDQVVLAVWRSALLGIPASVVLVLILGSSVPLAARIEFIVLVSVADVTCFAVLSSYRRRRRRGEVVPRFWVGPCCAALIGLAWGSLAFIGLPDESRPEMRIVYLLFIAGCSATYVVGTAARRTYFWASQLPMTIPLVLVFSQSDDRISRLLGIAIVIYLAVMAALHRDVHNLVLSEITLRQDNEAASKQLSYQATHDSLTGLASRAVFTTRLDSAFLSPADDALIAVLYIDVDRFKVVNDSLGHAAGDDLLVQVATRMAHVLDDSALLARIGGDEFAVILFTLGSQGAAIRIADRIAEALNEPFPIAHRSVSISASIGVATTRRCDGDAESLLAQADAAQYRAKTAGRNRVEVFNTQLRAALQRRLDDEQSVRRAIDDGEILAWFQPVVDLQTGHVIAAEALARWLHPTRGTLEAGKFVPLVEESGLITELDDCIIRQAVGAANHLRDHADRTDLRIWCNASALHFNRVHPTDLFAQLLEEAGCDGAAIGFEITETALLGDLEAAARELRAARELGIKIALDDFGVGHSSLMLLRSLPVDAVKIDRSFIRDMTRDAAAAAIVASIVSLANSIGIDAVAEGVETPEQARLLGDMGCRHAQGYLWAKAMPLDHLARHVASAATAPTLVARRGTTDADGAFVVNGD
jgi:diguanylate cyclase (GGDEF)-like protein